MSSEAQAGPSATEDKDKDKIGFRQKLLQRAKTLVKRPDGSRRLSVLSTRRKSTVVAGESSTTAPPAQERAVPEGATKIPKQQINEERARRLGERFGIEIKPNEWYSTEGHVFRVEKAARQRIHRWCHECSTPFGASKECGNCQHKYCKECGRTPARLSEAEKQASRQRRAALLKAHKENAPIVPDYRYDDNKENTVLKRPSKTGGQDLVYKKARQRIRRFCHECGTQFKVPAVKKCQNCDHGRCSDCPREPAKKNKYPYGYPGDEYGPNSVPFYECHECKTKFPPNPTAETSCAKCGHTKCDSCQRLKPQRVEPEPDPDVLKSLNEKLQNIRLKT